MEQSSEDESEVALIAEADLDRDLVERKIGVGDELARAIDAPAVRSGTYRPPDYWLEVPTKVRRAPLPR